LLDLNQALSVAGDARSMAVIAEILEEVLSALPEGEMQERVGACLHVLQRGQLSDYVIALMLSSLAQVSEELTQLASTEP
jgi:CHAD domain-containing protein